MRLQRPLILLLFGLYIFSPTLFNWVINPEGAWYRPFIIWAVIIVIAYCLQRPQDNSDYQ